VEAAAFGAERFWSPWIAVCDAGFGFAVFVVGPGADGAAGD
jgi:hypothetical protein